MPPYKCQQWMDRRMDGWTDTAEEASYSLLSYFHQTQAARPHLPAAPQKFPLL